jgi:hypothetical protein
MEEIPNRLVIELMNRDAIIKCEECSKETTAYRAERTKYLYDKILCADCERMAHYNERNK